MSDDRLDLPAPSSATFGQRVRETLQVYLGKRGDPLDRGVTFRDLNGLDITQTVGGSGGRLFTLGSFIAQFLGGDPKDLTPPPTPEGFRVTGGLANVFVEHANPTYAMGRGHGATVLYGVRRVPGDAVPTFVQAVKLAEFPGPVYAHPSDPSVTWNLWLTWKTRNGVESVVPAGGTNGLEVRTGDDPALLLQTLAGAIRAEQLYQSLSDRIDLIDGAMAGSVNARIASEATTRQDADSAEAAERQQLSAHMDTETGTLAAALQTEASARADADGTLQAQYTVKVDLNGYVAGYGLAASSSAADGTTSTFAIRADKFYVASPEGPGVAPTLPFVVYTTPTTIGGVQIPAGVYLAEAFIQDGTIGNAKIGNAAIDDAKIANLSAAKLTAGDGTIGGILKSSNFVVGTQGWRLMPDGIAEFSNAVVRGAVYASSGSFSGTVYASAGEFRGTVYASAGEFRGTVYASAGEFTGKITANTGTIGGLTLTSGGLNSGGYTGYGWPPAGKSGFHLGPYGLLAGNANDGKYFQITTDGNIYAPNFNVQNGAAYFNGSGNFSGNIYANGGYFNGELRAVSGVFVNTINIAGNAVTVSAAYSGAFPNWNIGPVLSLYMPQSGWVTAVVTATSASASAAILLDSTNVCTVFPAGFQNSATFLTATRALYVGAGAHSIYATVGGVSGSVTLFGMMR